MDVLLPLFRGFLSHTLVSGATVSFRIWGSSSGVLKSVSERATSECCPIEITRYDTEFSPASFRVKLEETSKTNEYASLLLTLSIVVMRAESVVSVARPVAPELVWLPYV